MAIETAVPRSRRALLAASLGGLAALAAQALGRPALVRAENEYVRVGGEYSTATSVTKIENTANNSTVLWGASGGSGAGVYGTSDSGVGVVGYSGSAGGVYGESDSGYGLRGYSLRPSASGATATRVAASTGRAAPSIRRPRWGGARRTPAASSVIAAASSTASPPPRPRRASTAMRPRTAPAAG